VAVVLIFSVLAKRLAGISISDMTYLVSSGTLNLNSVNQRKMLYMLLVCSCFDRSSNDGYCPSGHVDFIQTSLIHLLEAAYGDLDIKLNYLLEAEHS